MSNNTRVSLALTPVFGAGLAVLATLLPWYSFDVVLPVPGVVHVFAVTTTLWGVATLAPVLILVGAVAALVLTSVVNWRFSDVVTGLIGLAIVVYSLVRCIDVPNLGIPGLHASVPAITHVEGGPFLALAAGR
jgi:hypothetical protein